MQHCGVQVLAVCQWGLSSVLAITGAFELLLDKPHIMAPLAIAMAVSGGILIGILAAVRCSCARKRKLRDSSCQLGDAMV